LTHANGNGGGKGSFQTAVGRVEAAQPSSRFLYSKPPLGRLTKVSSPQKANPSEGTPQGPLPQERDLPKNHPHSNPNLSTPPSKQDISTLQRTGHFYFALTGVLWVLCYMCSANNSWCINESPFSCACR
jgi:hypothetical protein